MKPSLTRESYRAALRQVQQFVVEDMGQQPAFMTPLSSLPCIARRPLSDLPHARRPTAPGTVADAARLMTDGKLSASELVCDALAKIDALDPILNAFVQVVSKEELLAEANRLDAERAAGHVRSPLHGIPVSVKDVINVAGLLSTASSRVLEGNIAVHDAIAVARLKHAGAIIMGKTHTHEFALGVTTPQSRNPHDITRDPGGSSGGSAITVATGMSLASLGTDTRASIRVPSALCGIVGYKPTYGLVPTEGVITLSWSLDHTAHMTRTVEDAAMVLDVLAQDAKAYTAWLHKDAHGLRMGAPIHALDGCEPEVLEVFQTTLTHMRDLGVELVELDQPSADDFELCASMGLIISRCEAAEYHRPYRDKMALYTQPIADQLEESLQVSAVDYLHAQRFRAIFRQRMHRLMVDQNLDAFLMPTSRVTAPRTTEVEKYFMVLSLNCIPWSFIGFPALSVPCGRTAAGLPVGAELVAAPFEDGRLLAIAAALEMCYA